MDQTQVKPIHNLKSSLFHLERAHDDFEKARRELGTQKEQTSARFIAARDAANAMDKQLPERFMCGQWLFVFAENGGVAITEIQNSEPYHLIELARSMGEKDV